MTTSKDFKRIVRFPFIFQFPNKSKSNRRHDAMVTTSIILASIAFWSHSKGKNIILVWLLGIVYVSLVFCCVILSEKLVLSNQTEGNSCWNVFLPYSYSDNLLSIFIHTPVDWCFAVGTSLGICIVVWLLLSTSFGCCSFLFVAVSAGAVSVNAAAAFVLIVGSVWWVVGHFALLVVASESSLVPSILRRIFAAISVAAVSIATVYPVWLMGLFGFFGHMLCFILDYRQHNNKRDYLTKQTNNNSQTIIPSKLFRLRLYVFASTAGCHCCCRFLPFIQTINQTTAGYVSVFVLLIDTVFFQL